MILKDRQYGLIGYPLSHSFSKEYFTDKFKQPGFEGCRYENYEIEQVSRIVELFDEIQNLVGLNVTIPYKETVIPYLSRLDTIAQEVGAVNTVLRFNKHLIGFNTDVYGFSKGLDELIGSVSPASAFVLGSGGASKAVGWVLKSRNIPFKTISRQAKRGVVPYNEITPGMVRKTLLIINTTPLGMFPHVDTCPAIPYGELGPNHFLFDLVYNPEKTLFLKNAEAMGAQIINGLTMLQFQAEKAWEIWNNYRHL
jgi:shikimate dehydrogenase